MRASCQETGDGGRGAPKWCKGLLGEFVARESGATLIEYGLVAGIISVAIVAAVDAMGQGSVLDYFQSVTDAFETARRRVKS